MGQPKTFDCVQMKDEIQARLLSEREGIGEEEARALIRHRLATSGSPVAQLWRRLAAEGEQA
jgi:hypothetical protein